MGVSFGQLLAKGKDSCTALVAERLLRNTLSPYGRMLKLSIDSHRKKARLELLLKGESEPITITIDQYEWVAEDSQDFIVVRDASASREWADVLLKQFGLNRKIPVPDQYRTVLRMVV